MIPYKLYWNKFGVKICRCFFTDIGIEWYWGQWYWGQWGFTIVFHNKPTFPYVCFDEDWIFLVNFLWLSLTVIDGKKL